MLPGLSDDTHPTLLTSSRPENACKAPCAEDASKVPAKDWGSSDVATPPALSTRDLLAAPASAGSPIPATPAAVYHCCAYPTQNDAEVSTWDAAWLLDASAEAGQSAWQGSRRVASYLGKQAQSAAEFADPHVRSMTASAWEGVQWSASRAAGAIRDHIGRLQESAEDPEDVEPHFIPGLQPPKLEVPVLEPMLPGPYAFLGAPESAPWRHSAAAFPMTIQDDLVTRTERPMNTGLPAAGSFNQSSLSTAHTYPPRLLHTPLEQQPCRTSDTVYVGPKSMQGQLTQFEMDPRQSSFQKALSSQRDDIQPTSMVAPSGVRQANVLRTTPGRRVPLAQKRIESSSEVKPETFGNLSHA